MAKPPDVTTSPPAVMRFLVANTARFGGNFGGASGAPGTGCGAAGSVVTGDGIPVTGDGITGGIVRGGVVIGGAHIDLAQWVEELAPRHEQGRQDKEIAEDRERQCDDEERAEHGDLRQFGP